MLKWILIGFFLFLLYRWTQRLPKYTDLTSAEHLRELSAGLERVFPVALGFIGKDPPQHPFSAGTAFTTSARVNVFYTIAKSDKGTFEHHISMNSSSARPLSKESAGFIAAGMARLLGPAGERGMLAESKSHTFHFIVPFSAEEHDKMTGRGIDALDESAARTLYEFALTHRDHLVDNIGKLDVKVPKS